MRYIPLVFALCFSTTAVHAETLQFHTVLSGSKEKVPNNVPATGTATVTLDTISKTITYRVEFSGLSGAPKMVHFHGPRLPGAKAPEVIVMRADHPSSPVTGTADVTDAQIQELKDGQWYANVHSDKYRDGEIRGWLMQDK